MKELAEKAAAFGIDMGYHDFQGNYRFSPPSTIRAIIEVLESGDALERTPISLRPGDEVPLQGGVILTEEGRSVPTPSALPSDFPTGYHQILAGGQRVPRRLIVAPDTCYLPDLVTWGWALQLYSIRSKTSWGIGDLHDLAALGRWSSELGARAMLINPLGAVTPGPSIQPSPYSPGSRCFRNPVYLGLDNPPPEAVALNSSELIERDPIYRLKMQALEEQFNGAEAGGAFGPAGAAEAGGAAGPAVTASGDQAFGVAGADKALDDRALEDFATFCAIAETQSMPWPTWPERLQSPEASGIPEFKQQHARRIRFHMWVQQQIDEQLAAAGKTIGLIQDLPVGIDPSGADAWIFPGALAQGFSAGAPPDEFNRAGQGWGLAPLHPRSLAGHGLDCFRKMLRSGFAHSMGLRIDHVMGLFRLFWIPDGCDPAEGAYVRYPARQLLDILAIESRRAESIVVGEDLGTVEPGVREALAERRVLSYRLMLFEDPKNFTEHSMAAVTTHDLPTIAGIWSGYDAVAQEIAGVPVNSEGLDRMREMLAGEAGTDSSAEEMTLGAYRKLAQSQSMLVMATLEDATGVEKRPNMPGTVDSWPNWRIPLPCSLEEIVESKRVRRVAEAAGEGRSNT